MQHEPRIGLVARCDNGGLGIESLEFYRALRPARVLCVCGTYENHPERFPGAAVTGLQPSDRELEDFLGREGDLDSVLTIETPYNWRLFELAGERWVRSVMKVNYEWLELRASPDVYVAPNAWHFLDLPDPKLIAALPVDLERFRFVERRRARTFLHVAGHNAGYDRNGTGALVDAMKYLRSDVRIVVRTQQPLPHFACFGNGTRPLGDPRLTVSSADLEHNEALYEAADALILPRRYGGQSLVMDEAAACGMPMILSDMEPQRSLFSAPAAEFVPLANMNSVRIKREVELGDVSAWELAAAIDRLAAEPPEQIAERSRAARAAVAGRSWGVWRNILSM